MGDLETRLSVGIIFSAACADVGDTEDGGCCMCSGGFSCAAATPGWDAGDAGSRNPRRSSGVAGTVEPGYALRVRQGHGIPKGRQKLETLRAGVAPASPHRGSRIRGKWRVCLCATDDSTSARAFLGPSTQEPAPGGRCHHLTSQSSRHVLNYAKRLRNADQRAPKLAQLGQTFR